MNHELLERFKQTLLTNKKPSKLTVDGKEIWCRCPYCGDSTKHLYRGHFYIKLEPPFKFYCQKCTESGYLTNNTLRDLGLDSSDLFLMLAQLNADYQNSDHYVPPPEKKKLIQRVYNTYTEEKNLEYIKNRFKINLHAAYVSDTYRCVLDAPSFFEDNNLQPKMNFDFENSVGFISSDQSHISFRDTSGKNPLRYIIYTINDIGTKTCLVKNPINIMMDVFDVHIAEGMFDIMGIKESRVTGYFTSNHDIFAAACGKSYLRAIKEIVNRGFLNLNIHIYSDSDVDPSFFQYLKRDNIEFRHNNVNLYYNDIGKDFGVPENQIKIRKGVI